MDGLREFTTFLGKVETELKKAEWLNEATEFVAYEAQRRVPVHTSELSQSIQHQVTPAEGGMQGEVYTDNDHAHYVEFGTGPVGARSDHSKVSPYVPLQYSGKAWFLPYERKPSLAWDYGYPTFEGDDGRDFFKLYGQPAQPFMYPALKDNEEKVIEIANKGIKKALRSK